MMAPPKEAGPPQETHPAMTPREDGARRERHPPDPDDQQNLPFFEIDEGRSSGDDADA